MSKKNIKDELFLKERDDLRGIENGQEPLEFDVLDLRQEQVADWREPIRSQQLFEMFRMVFEKVSMDVIQYIFHLNERKIKIISSTLKRSYKPTNSEDNSPICKPEFGAAGIHIHVRRRQGNNRRRGRI